jgi:hypothetical protein
MYHQRRNWSLFRPFSENYVIFKHKIFIAIAILDKAKDKDKELACVGC